MNKYTVNVVHKTYFDTTIEANNIDEAKELAKELVPVDFEVIPGEDDWEIYNIEEASGGSFIDDEEKMIDFCYLSKDEFLQFYLYLSEEDYDATVNEIINRSGYWHKEWYEDNPDMDGRALKDIVFGIMMTEWLAQRKEKV